MNGEISLWNFGLLFSSISFLLGIIGIVVSRHGTDRSIASGLILQGVLLTFVVGGTYSQQSREMKLGGLVIVGLLVIHGNGSSSQTLKEHSSSEETST